MDAVNTQEMINVIKDAGMYEDHMSKEQMELYYKAIVDSKDASTAEQGSRIINDSPEDMFALDLDPTAPPSANNTSVESQLEDSDFESSAFKPKVRSYNRKNSDKEHIKKNISAGTQEDESIPQDATKACFSFDDMPKDNDSPLVIIYHPPSYINIQNSEKFISTDVATRAMMLFKYHSEMEKLRSALSRQSFFPAPRPKPIEITTSAYAFDFETVKETEETYISRAGRQTKRKVYNDEDFETSTTNKKAKSKSVERPKWQSKLKPPKKTELVQESMETETTEVVQKETPKQSIRTKKLSNSEIMSRSKLFEDSPIKRSSRSEKLFDKLKEESIKKQRDERKLEAFEKTLCPDNESSQKEENMIQVADEEYPKRVIPPIPTKRKPINSRAQQQKSNSNNSSQEKENDLFESVGPSTSHTAASTNVECPICLKTFSEDSVAEHASNCGEEQIVTRNTSRHKITCPKCDKVITSNYELHTSMCKKHHEKLDSDIE